jgi:non-homologous end joining protein Ku
LIETLEGGFDIANFHDDYREQVQRLIARKAKGQVIPLHPRKKAAPVLDLTDALQNSLKSVKRKKSA